MAAPRKSTQMRPVSIAGSKSGTLTRREWGKVKRSRILERIGETIWSIVSFVCGGYYIIGVLILAVAVASVPLLFIWEFAEEAASRPAAEAAAEAEAEVAAPGSRKPATNAPGGVIS